MGLNLCVETENATLLRICTDLFGGFGPGDPQRTADLHFTLRVSQPADVTVHPVFQFEDKWAYASAGNEQVIRANLATGEVHGCFPRELLHDETMLRHHYLQFALAVILTARGFAGIHAAGLERNGRTVLVRGARGSGKSILAYAAVESGWRVLADSTVWIGANGDWWGIPWWLRLRRSAASLFPKLTFDSSAFIAEEADGEAKLEISVDQIRSGGGVTHAPAGIVLFLEQNLQGDSWIDTLVREEAFALWPTGGAGRETLAPSYRERIEKILGEGAYRLCLGRNPDQAIEVVDRYLESRTQLSG
jgi:hypothetical protein